MTEVEGLDDVYAGPLDEFVSRRNELARSLKAGGDETGAAEVKALKKPSVSAWVVNQLAHHHADDLQRLIDAAAAMENEQRKALSGEASDLLTPKQREQEAIARLRTIATDDVMPAITGATLERVTSSLLNGARSDEGRATLASGRLQGDLDPPGFDAYASFTVFPPSPPKAPEERKSAGRRTPSKPNPSSPRSVDDAADTDPAESEISALEGRAHAAREKVEAARAEADEAERKAAEAKELADLLARQAAEAVRRLGETQDELVRLEAEIEALRS